MSRHVVKSAISVNCVKSYGEVDVVKLVFAMARYILNMRKGTTKYVDTTYVPKTEEYKNLMCKMWRHTLLNPEDLPCMPAINRSSIKDGLFAENVGRLSIPIAYVNSPAAICRFKPVFLDIVTDPVYVATQSWLDDIPKENSIRYVKDQNILCQKTYIDLLRTYGVLEELNEYISPEGNI